MLAGYKEEYFIVRDRARNMLSDLRAMSLCLR